MGRGDSVGPQSVIALQKEGKQWEMGLISRASVQGKWMSPLQEKKNPRDYFLITPEKKHRSKGKKWLFLPLYELWDQISQ